MFNFFKKFLRILLYRYKYNLQEDWQVIRQVFFYYTRHPLTLREYFKLYYLHEIALMLVKFFFKLLVWWPLNVPYLLFCIIVRYVFVLWHFFFLDLLLPAQARRWGRQSFVYGMFRRFYAAIAWLERFLLNYFGILLLWYWWLDCWRRRLPAWLLRKEPVILYRIGLFLAGIEWVVKTWSKLWDYGMSCFNPYAYYRTRYYLSAHFRRKLKRVTRYILLWMRVSYAEEETTPGHYWAFFLYWNQIFFINARFVLSKPFLSGQGFAFILDYGANVFLLCAFLKERLLAYLWALSPALASFLLTLSYRFWRWHLRPAFWLFRHLHNYYFTTQGYWSKAKQRALKLGFWKRWRK